MKDDETRTETMVDEVDRAMFVVRDHQVLKPTTNEDFAKSAGYPGFRPGMFTAGSSRRS